MSMKRSELQDSARKAFGETGLVSGADASWSNLSDMGWLMMTVPEAQGGLGMSAEAAGVIHYELGRALVPGPIIAQMLVIEALAATGQDALLTRAMGGEIMTTSLGLPGAGNGLANVPDADRASLLLIDHVDYMRIVPLHACTMTQRTTWDETRRLYDVELPSKNVGEDLIQGTSARALSDRLQATKLLALSADSLGGAEAALAMTINYLKTRRQFDRPLAMFQALKHRVADLKIAHVAAEALFWNRVTGTPSLAEMGALKAHCTNAYARVAEEAIQLHGGIGLTLEHPCHLFLKRAFLNCALGGDADHWEEAAGRAVMETIR